MFFIDERVDSHQNRKTKNLKTCFKSTFFHISLVSMATLTLSSFIEHQ